MKGASRKSVLLQGLIVFCTGCLGFDIGRLFVGFRLEGLGVWLGGGAISEFRASDFVGFVEGSVVFVRGEPHSLESSNRA